MGVADVVFFLVPQQTPSLGTIRCGKYQKDQ